MQPGGGGTPSITYVIPFYNGHRHLPEAIESVLSQSATDIEVVVVDDGSPEDCRAIVEGFGTRVRMVRTANHGVSGARNIGLAEARGEFVSFLDQDDVVYRHHAARLIEAIRRHPNASAAFCDVWLLREGMEPLRQDFARYETPIELFKTRMTLSIGALVFRRSALVGLGGFDLTASNVGEDWDFCLRVMRFRDMVYVREPLFGFRRHPAQASRGADRMAKGALQVLGKHREYRLHRPYEPREVARAREGILGYWAEWYRRRLKDEGLFTSEGSRLLLHLALRPRLALHVVLPPLRTLGTRRERPIRVRCR